VRIKQQNALSNDECGGALLEYTVLIAIILGGAVLFVPSVGDWAKEEWTTFYQLIDNPCTLPSKAEPCIPPGHTK
jgi:Flp pilus assembly pilin Flp